MKTAKEYVNDVLREYRERSDHSIDSLVILFEGALIDVLEQSNLPKTEVVTNNRRCVAYQNCSHCGGKGFEQQLSVITCTVCGGKKMIPQYLICNDAT